MSRFLLDDFHTGPFYAAKRREAPFEVFYLVSEFIQPADRKKD
jgi:hypothetical protein